MPLQPDPEREAAIAQGVGMIEAGFSMRSAAEASGIPLSTLHASYHRVLGPSAPNVSEERKKADERIMASAYCVAEQAMARMAHEIEHAEHKTVTAWAEVSSRVLARMRGWDAKGGEQSDTAPRWANAIASLLGQGGAKLTLTLEPANDTDQRQSGAVLDYETQENANDHK